MIYLILMVLVVGFAIILAIFDSMIDELQELVMDTRKQFWTNSIGVSGCQNRMDLRLEALEKKVNPPSNKTPESEIGRLRDDYNACATRPSPLGGFTKRK